MTWLETEYRSPQQKGVKMRSFIHISLGAASLLILSAGQVQSASTVPEAAVKMGAQLYNQNCSVCHQADAIGKPGFAPSLTNPELLSTASDKFLMSTIRDGRSGTGMMPFTHLGRKKIKAIVAYLQSHAKLPNKSAAVDAEEIFRDVIRASAGTDTDLSGILEVEKVDGVNPYQQLRNLRGIQWPAPSYAITKGGGTKRRYMLQEGDWKTRPYGYFRTKDGKVHIKLCQQDYSDREEITKKLMEFGAKEGCIPSTIFR